MDYKAVSLKDDIVIDDIVTVHYFEYTKEYYFPGEMHDFWELVFMDKGEAIAVAEEESIPLKQGDLIFHKPNEWHNIVSNGKDAPNIAIVSFVCNSPVMKFFENRKMNITASQRWLIARMIEEAEKVFEKGIGDPYIKQMVKYENTPIGAEQLIKLYLTEFLLSFLTSVTVDNPEIRKSHHADFNNIVAYLENNISSKLTIEDICMVFNISPTTLKNLFRNNAKKGVMAYFIGLKMGYAKQYIRDGVYNFTQISQLLGYDTPNYFSYQFKKYFNMTPTEYAQSIKSMQAGEKYKKADK